MNTFGYVGGNPTKYSDFSGLKANATCVAACRAAGAITGRAIGTYGGGFLGAAGGAGLGTLVAPGPGTISGGGAGAAAGSQAGGLGGTVAGGFLGDALGEAFCPDEEEEQKKCEPGEFGPFHRKQGHDSATTELVVMSNQLWGRARRGSDNPQVQAWNGNLPEGTPGVGFCTTVPPASGGHPNLPVWYKGQPGVFDVPGNTGFVGIFIRVIKSR